jgi:hypothetical protein
MIVNTACKCSQCRAHPMHECINQKCDCCSLEDMFSVLTRADDDLLKVAGIRYR